jgi:hypothetical protein
MYVYAFCIYALNALFLLLHAAKKSMPVHRTPFLPIVVPQVVGMLFLGILASLATRRTSRALEKCVLILTTVICLLFVGSVLPEYGYNLPIPLYSHSVFVAVSCAAALLAGWRMLEIAITETDTR